MSRRIRHHSETRVRVKDDCNHPYESDEPSSYLGWYEWAEQKTKTHEQKQCPHCGLWVIWKPKPEAGLDAKTIDEEEK